MNGGTNPAKPILIKPEGITVRRSTDTVADDNPLIRKVLLYIRDNLHHPFGAEQVADALNESRSRLDKTCAARFGRSLGKVILAHRLAEAKRLLLKTDLNIDEIAARTGFCASNYLIKKFKSATGHTPFKWKKRMSPHRPSSSDSSASRPKNVSFLFFMTWLISKHHPAGQY